MYEAPESAVSHCLAVQPEMREVLQVARMQLFAGQICQKSFLSIAACPRVFLLQEILNESVGQPELSMRYRELAYRHRG